MSKLLSYMMLFATLSLPVSARDLTQFDFPFLIGDWYWFSPTQVDSDNEAKFKAINISFTSDYQFKVKLLTRDGKVQQASGSYDLDETTLVLLDSAGETQYHGYKLNHHQLELRGTIFTKLLPRDISGSWVSRYIQGMDVGDNVAEMALMLRPDFIFSMKVSDKKGKSKTHKGVYFMENDHLVLIYRGGQQDSQFELEENTLILSSTQFDMEAELQRNIP